MSPSIHPSISCAAYLTQGHRQPEVHPRGIRGTLTHTLQTSENAKSAHDIHEEETGVPKRKPLNMWREYANKTGIDSLAMSIKQTELNIFILNKIFGEFLPMLCCRNVQSVLERTQPHFI